MARGDAENRTAAAEAKAAELYVVMARSLAQQAERIITCTADKARSGCERSQARSGAQAAEVSAASAAKAEAVQ